MTEMPSLSALPERFTDWIPAACPFGGPALGGPLSSEECRNEGGVRSVLLPERLKLG